MKIVQIDGIKGLISAVFLGACLFAGFVISPGYVAMSLWNKYLTSTYLFPSLSLFQGVLLWGIVVISYCLVSKKGFALSFKSTPEISDEELNSIMKVAKINSQMKMMNKIMTNSDKFVKKHETTENVTDEHDKSLVSSPFKSEQVNKTEDSEENIANIK